MNKMLKFYVMIGVAVLLLAGTAIADYNQTYYESMTGARMNNNPVALLSGGPDAYGYYFYDSNDMAYNAPQFNWIDISGYGTNMGITGDDQNEGPFSIGFTFNFYGVDFISFRACSNGFISFSSTIGGHSNQTIPTADEPNDLLAVFWDDLHPRETGQAYYYSNNTDTLIVSWHNFQRYSGDGEYSFQAIITADGNILYQYLSLTGILDSHTIGIENQYGTIGLEYVYNTAMDETGTAILFSTTPPDYGEKDILVIAADEASTFISELAAYTDIAVVDYYDSRNGTPTLELLHQYDGAIVWSNYAFYDPTAMGDVLADYEDEGGAVVMLVFTFNSGWNMQGRLMTDYCPFTVGNGSYEYKSLGDYDIGHPIMQGVDSLVEYYSAEVTLQYSPIVVASYTDGTPLAAYNTENNLVALNYYIGNYRNISGDAIDLTHNAINFACDGPADILIAAADYGGELAERDLMEMPGIEGINYYDLRYATPSLELLNLYDAVVVWSNFPFDDAATLGNRLADYVDMGGGVVLHLFSFYEASSYGLEGRIMDSYSPLGTGPVNYETRTLGWYNADHPLMQGVSEVTEYFTAEVTIENDGVNVASWDDSTPFVAYNPDYDVVAINGYIGDDRECTGDMMLITYNALNMVRDMVDIDETVVSLPEKFKLAQNYPNPFNANTIIRFVLPQQSNVVLDIYNIMGQRVTSIDKGDMPAGSHFIRYDASEISSGVYFYRLTAGDLVETRKMTLVK